MNETTASERFFSAVLKLKWIIIAVGFALIAASASFLPTLTKDTTADSFISPDQPALLTREVVEDVFGLKDPFVIAVVDKDEDGVFDAETLGLVAEISDRVQRLRYVDPERVTSLATENNIVGVIDGLVAEGFFDEDTEVFQAPPGTQARAAEVKAAIDDFPLMQGNLVARDGTATIIIAELIDERQATEAYDALMESLDGLEKPEGVDIHVAGEGAVSGYLADYIDRDARRLNPIAGIVITLVLLLAFMSLRSTLLPNLIILATVAGSLGMMAALGVSFFVITNGLIVNLIGIAVADSIHIMSAFYAQMRDRPQADKRETIVRAMASIWRPVTLTSITTIVGFAALAASSVMPPVYYFGIFGAVGVGVAWAFSLLFLPALLAVWPGKRLPAPFRRRADGAATENVTARLMRGFGRAVLAAPRMVIAAAVLASLAGAIGATRVVVDEARIENFKSTEPLYKADYAINEAMDGTYYLDVLVETTAPQGLYNPEALRRIETLQAYLTSLPYVNGSTSIVDYVKQLHRSVNEGRPEFYTIPDDPLLVSQLIFLYNASADPTDFEEEVDSTYTQALVRANVNVGRYTVNDVIVPAVERYLEETFNSDLAVATATGRVTVDYYWIRGIGDSVLFSIALAFGAVLIVAMLLFRSIVGGLIAGAPVAAAVLVVYAVMGFSGIPLGVGTSMFSAIAIGLSIDFAIHALDRLRELVRARGFGDHALIELYPSTGRALLFNFVAVGGGFAVLISSDVPALGKFGALVAVAVSTAFIASMTLLPALVKVLKPRFLLSGADKGSAAPTPKLSSKGRPHAETA